MVADLFIDPDRFFADASTDEGLTAPLLVVLLAGIAGVLGTLIVVPKMMGALPSGIGGFAAAGYVVGSAVGILTMFALWFVYTGIFYAVSGFFDADGEFRDLFVLVGWGFVPSIFNGVVGAAMMYYALSSVSFPSDPSQLEPFLQQLRSRSTFAVSSGLSVVFTLWSGMLWTFAVKNARQVTIRQAAATVALPVISSVAWTLYNLA